MPGGLGGSSPAGNTTVTQINPTQAAQKPFLEGGWQAASNVRNDPNYQPPGAFTYYPGQTLANFDPAMLSAYIGMENTGYNQFPVTDAATQAYLTGVGGGYGSGANPATPYFTAGAGDDSAANWVPKGAIQGLYDTAGAAAGPNAGTSQLTDVASGKYLGPNQYLDAAIKAAFDPTTRAFQTSVWPGINMSAEGAGRYGSGVMSNQRSQAEQNLARQLSLTAGTMTEADYARERAAQDAAATGVQGNALDRLRAQQAGYGAAATAGLGAGSLEDTVNRTKLAAAQGLSSAFTTGNDAALRAMGLTPQILASMQVPNQSILEAGKGITALDQAKIQDAMNRYYGTENAPWETLNRYMAAIGQPTGGSSSTTQPYFSNPTANLLGTGLGGLQLLNAGNTAFGSGGALSGLFGGAGAAAGVGSPLYSGVTSAFAADVAAGGLGEAAASALPAAAKAAAPVAVSDRRLKTDIERVGRLDNGLPVYRYRYIGDPVTQIGLMADEVERVIPAAVITMTNGYKAVDYHRATGER